MAIPSNAPPSSSSAPAAGPRAPLEVLPPPDPHCTCLDRDGRNLVVCIDGTSNQFCKNNTNVVELYNRLIKDKTQLTYYNSGIGTFAKPSWFSFVYAWQWMSNAVDLVFARRIDKIVQRAYRWLSENYEPGDRIFLFGFSRGAYQVRVLAAMIDSVGLLHKGNLDQIPFAYRLYATSKPEASASSAPLPDPANDSAVDIDEDLEVEPTTKDTVRLDRPRNAPVSGDLGR